MTAPLVRAVDHVFVPVEDPEPLFRLFTGDLGLPAAWPVHDYGTFRSGGVCLGDANLEFVAGDTGPNPFFAPTEPLSVRGIGFEPVSAGGWSEALDRRLLRHTDPIPHTGDGARASGHLWTTQFVGGLVGDAAVVFLCRYEAEEALRGEAARRTLVAAGGGLLGLRGVVEIQVGVADRGKAMRRWGRLLDPVSPDPFGCFRLPAGPAIRIRRAPADGVAGLVLAVASTAAIREPLRARGLLGPMRASGFALDYARTGGLDVWLTDAR